MSDAARPPRIAVLGSVNVDVVVRAARLPAPGETVVGSSVALTLGGKGANQAAAARRLGADVVFIACTGADQFGAFARAELAGFDLDLSRVRESAGESTGVATIGVDASGQNAIAIVPGANAAVSVADVERAAEALRACDCLLLQCETPFAPAIAAAQIVRAAGGKVILDPAPAPAGGLPAALLALVDVITPNESEAASLTGVSATDEAGARAAAEALGATISGVSVVKCGANGLVFHHAGRHFALPPFKVVAVDTVAAGDCFNAGLGVAMASRLGLADALRFASACGALAATRPGAASAAPRMAEVQALLAAALN